MSYQKHGIAKYDLCLDICFRHYSALLNEENRDLLKKLLKQLRGGKTKVLITSRSPENWLTSQECYHMPLAGLQGEELWEYCNAIVRDLGLKIERTQEDFKQLIDELDGNPLAIRAILLRLPKHKATNLLADLKREFIGQEGDESTKRIMAALRIFDRNLPTEFTPILQLIGLHERYVQQDIIKHMLIKAGDTATLVHTVECFNALETAGLLYVLGQNVYRMHPALHSHLNRQHAASETRQRAFVGVMSEFADKLTSKELYQQRFPFVLYGGNIYHALLLAQTLGMVHSVAVFTQSLAAYAVNIRDYAKAKYLFENLAEYYKQQGAEGEADPYHNLGAIAQEQRDYAAAERWYKQSLAISEKHGDEPGTASTYHQLGRIAEEQRDYAAAERWYKQSLAIKERV